MSNGRLHAFRILPGPYQIASAGSRPGKVVLETRTREGEARTVYHRLLPDGSWSQEDFGYDEVADEIEAGLAEGRRLLASITRRRAGLPLPSD
jgi:hypothetical protein